MSSSLSALETTYSRDIRGDTTFDIETACFCNCMKFPRGFKMRLLKQNYNTDELNIGVLRSGETYAFWTSRRALQNTHLVTAVGGYNQSAERLNVLFAYIPTE